MGGWEFEQTLSKQHTKGFLQPPVVFCFRYSSRNNQGRGHGVRATTRGDLHQMFVKGFSNAILPAMKVRELNLKKQGKNETFF